MAMLSEEQRRALVEAFTDEKTEELPIEELLADGERSVELGDLEEVSQRYF